ncbi:MAG: IS21 family transposase, partial [Chloroflexota bacterium]
KVARDQLAVVAKALYSLPHRYVGHVLTARADQQLVRLYQRGVLIKTHPRQPPGGRSIDATDYPVERSVYALRNVTALQQQATSAGEAIGRYAAALLDSPLPWTRMRRVYALLGLVRRYGAARVNDACTTALAADMLDVHRLKRMLELASTITLPAAPPARGLPLARYLRPASQYALPLHAATRSSEGGEPQ